MYSEVGRILFLIIGLVALSIGAWQGWTTATLIRHAVATTGRVVGESGVSGGQSSAHPSIEFRTAAGVLVRYRQNGMGARAIGSTMPVLYDSAAPAETAVVPAFWTLWFPAIGPVVLGVLFIGAVLSGAEIGLRGVRP